MSEPQSIGVLGAGVMGGGIAQGCAIGCYEVHCYDIAQDALTAGHEHATTGRYGIESAVTRGLLSREDADAATARLHFTGSFEEFLAQRFPTSTAADFAVLEAGVVSEETYVEQGLYWATGHQPMLEYVVRTYQPDLLLAGVPTKAGLQTGLNGRQLETLCYWPDPPPPIYPTLSSPDQVREKWFWVLAAFPSHEFKQLDPVLDQFRSLADERQRFMIDKGGVAILFERR